MIDVEKLAMEAGCDKLEHLTKEDREFLDRFAALVLEAAALECDVAAARSAESHAKAKTIKASDIYGAAESRAIWLSSAIRAMKPGESNE